MQKIVNFLMFNGEAEKAMNFYCSLFPDSKITHITHYKANQGGDEGTVMLASFVLNGREFKCIDSSVKHQFTFTPAFSLYIDCDSDMEIEKLFSALTAGGSVLMPLDAYPFSKKYAWITDQYGISWQLNYNK